MSELQELWELLATQALLGSTSMASREAPSDPELAAAWTALGGRTPEGDLLARAAALGLARRAGVLSTPWPGTLPAEAALDDRPPLPLPAVARLTMLLAPGQDEQADQVLREWLQAAAKWRPVPETLPALLTRAQRSKDLRPPVLAFAGPLGDWLAGQNAAWRFATAEPPPDWSAWETTSGPARPLLLRAMRRVEPGRARLLLESTWDAEVADAKAGLVGALDTGLSDADEGFLETRLDNRRKEVRRAAATLLWRLPASRLVQRAQARAAACVVIRDGALDVTLPAACDKPMLRDGVEAKGGPYGERASWLQQLVAMVPTATWTAGGQAPGQLVAATRGHDFRDPLLHGWAVAATREADPRWLLALLDTTWKDPPGVREGLVRTLPSDAREQWLVQLARTGAGDADVFWQALALADELERPWSRELAIAALAGLRAHTRQGEHRLRSWFGLLARRLPWDAGTVALVEQDWASPPAGLPPQLARSVGTFLDLLRFRHAMHQELSP